MINPPIQLVKGKTVDEYTRCVHYHSPLDVIAIKFKCCRIYYPCHECHQEEADHQPQVWSKDEFDRKAILCGICKTELTISEYVACDNRCPVCSASFNP